MNFKGMMEENLKINRDTRNFYRSYGKEVAVTNLVVIGVVMGALTVVDKIRKTRLEKQMDIQNETESES